MRRSLRGVVVCLAWLVLISGGRTPRAAEPAGDPSAIKPPWQRYLQGDDARQAAEWKKQLAQLAEAGKFEEALKAAERVAELRVKVQGSDHWQTVSARWDAEAMRRALRQEKETRTAYSGSFALERQGRTLQILGRYQEAQALGDQVLAIRRKVLSEEHPDTAQSYVHVAAAWKARSQRQAAEDADRTALAIRRKVLGEEHPFTSLSYSDLADNRAAQGDYRGAEQYYRKALAIRRKVLGDDHPFTTLSYNSLLVNLNAQGKYAEAEQHLRKALTLCRKLLGEEHPDTARSYNNLAVVLNEQGKYTEAEEGYRQALAIYRKVRGEEHPETANSYNNEAYNLSAQGRFAEAEKGLLKALAIRRKVHGEEHPDTAQSYNNVAYNANAQGRYAEAEAGYRKALAINSKVLGENHPSTALSYNNVATNQGAQGKYAEAEQGYRKALAFCLKVLGEEHSHTARSYNNVAVNLNAQGKYGEAERLWRRAGDSFAKARLRIAASGLGRAAKTSEASPLPSLAAILARNGKPNDAWQRFEESLARGTWDDMSAQLRRPATEQAKQTGLVNRLNRLDQLVEKTFSAKGDTAELKKRRENLLTQRRQTQDELDAFGRHMEETYGPVAGQVFNRQQIQASLPADTALIGWLDIPDQFKAADPNGEHWAILLRSAGPPVWVRLRGSGTQDAWTDADTRLPAELRAALQSSRRKSQPLAQRLSRQRLQPLAKHLEASDGLPAVRRLIVLPSTALAGVPVEIFADGYTVSYAHSGTLHAHLHKQPKLTSTGLFALADPVFEQVSGTEQRRRDRHLTSTRGDDTWPPLPGTRIEAEALRRLFGVSSKLLMDSEASEQSLYELAKSGELGQYRYLHLATHGDVDNRAPLRSAVILSRDHLPDPGKQLDAGLPVYDGQLTAEEVLRQWHLNSELVTLSACQTALGKYERGEGFVGFAQALILSGSRSVCLSLWKVDDAATALLMERFYQNLLGKREGLKQPMGKAASLAEAKSWLRGLSREEAVKREAQLSKGVVRGKGRKELPLLPAVPEATVNVKEDRPYAHPYYWGAFVLIGDPD
jgi:CHAT domain-containing protein